MKIAICLPVYGDTKARFTFSLFALTVETLKQRPEIEFQGHLEHGNYRIAKARETLAELALRGGAERLLWLDADHIFPADALLRLLAHNLPIAGCNYRPRKGPNPSTAGNIRSGRADWVAPKREGLEPVDFFGFGVALISAEVFHALPRPWFVQSALEGEDVHFCRKAREAGFQPQIDHAIKVGHIAETVLTFPR